MNILAGLTLLPLRVNISNFNLAKQNTSVNSTSLIIGIGVVVLLIVVVVLVNNRMMANQKKGDSGKRRFSYFALHRVARDLGLNRDQTRMLEYVLKVGAVSDPESFLGNSDEIDRHFKRAYRLIERSASTTEDLNNRLALLFSTRNVIESNVGGGAIATSTRQIPEKTAAILSIGDMNYPVTVISSRGDYLVVSHPVNNLGKQVTLSRGVKAHLSIFGKSNKGFSVETRVINSADSPRGPAVQLAHSGEIKRLSNRRFRRRHMIISTNFFYVHVEQISRKQTRMVVDKRRFAGNIMDISMGGCSIKTNTPINSGQRIKIEFTSEDSTIIAALGEVLRVNRTGINTVMHIKFLKVPRKSLNAINAMVFEYTDD